MSPYLKLWRESASLIILAKNSSKFIQGKCNYKLIVFKRSARGFYPGGVVFPGGVVEESDSLKDWLKLYESLGVHTSDFENMTVTGNRPPIFRTEPDQLQREISLRITGIRETFEELGLLICKDAEEIKQLPLNNPYANFKSGIDIAFWQKKVHQNPKMFFNLCEQYRIVPDLWGTHEWADWLTPSIMKKRFETAFFLVALNEMPEIFSESSEVDEYYWKTPHELLSEHQKNELFLPPPQHYEILRLSGLLDIDNIAHFAQERGNKGVPLMYPVLMQAKDGVVHVLPGDYAYPKEPNLTNPGEYDKSEFTVEELRPKNNEGVHRLESTSGIDYRYNLKIANLVSLYGHFLPKPLSHL